MHVDAKKFYQKNRDLQKIFNKITQKILMI